MNMIYPLAMQVSRNAAKSQFEIIKDGELAVAQYEMAGAQMTVTHILVPGAIEGRGVASALCQFIVQTARAERLIIMPQCPFMAAYLRRHPENSDLVAA